MKPVGPAVADRPRLGGRAGYPCLGAPPIPRQHAPPHPAGTLTHAHQSHACTPNRKHLLSLSRQSPHTSHLPPDSDHTRLPTAPPGHAHAGTRPASTLRTAARMHVRVHAHSRSRTRTKECSDSTGPHSPPRRLLWTNAPTQMPPPRALTRTLIRSPGHTWATGCAHAGQ